MSDNVIQFPGPRADLSETEPEDAAEKCDTQVIAYQRNSVPDSFAILPKTIPPADRKKCPHPGCNEYAMYRFSWYLKQIEADGEISYIKVDQRLEVISCHNRKCIARARNIVRRNFWADTLCSVPMPLP